jgi:hypothetical protein
MKLHHRDTRGTEESSKFFERIFMNIFPITVVYRKNRRFALTRPACFSLCLCASVVK